ncbi:universal stress protein [Halorubrum rubrum]|uniref:Universal stress protein n=1 Tax=Halorubrum rubrum TaxID=1126240 RepID=A0ABD5R2E1_9EURY|nr:universal stress protein [Halorubrum rubrum]
MYGSDADDGSGEGGGVGEGVGDVGGETPTDPATESRLPATGPSLETAVEEAAASVGTAARATLNGADRATGPERTSSILVAVAVGPHSGVTVDVAKRVAEATDAWLELFHVTPSIDGIDGGASDADSVDEDGAEEAAGERILDAARDRLGAFDRVDRWLLENDSVAGAIVEQSPYYDLVVVGAPTTGTVGRLVFGSTTDTVVDESAVPVVVVEADGETPIVEE